MELISASLRNQVVAKQSQKILNEFIFEEKMEVKEEADQVTKFFLALHDAHDLVNKKVKAL